MGALDTVSFRDYKINYNHCLGSGIYGTVYEVVKRPENEKGYLSYYFPYVYDFIFPPNEKGNIEKTNLCVKISKSVLRIIFENIGDGLVIDRIAGSFTEPSKEKTVNSLLQKHKLSKIKFYPSESSYSQFKTMVNGHTFQFYMENNYFVNPGEYQLRKAFVEFLSSIANLSITFWDIHGKNIMYDEVNSVWEIVDGEVEIREMQSTDQNQELDISLLRQDRILGLLGTFNLGLFSKTTTKSIFGKLVEIAIQGIPYTEEMDKNLLRDSDSIT